MRRPRNTSQIIEQNKTPVRELNKMETNNLLDAEFKTLVIRMLTEIGGRVDELRENFNSIKKAHNNHKKEPVRNEGYTN